MSADTERSDATTRRDRLDAVLLLAIGLVAFLPTIWGLARNAVSMDQLHNALAVLFVVAFDKWLRGGAIRHPGFSLHRASFIALGASYSLALASNILPPAFPLVFAALGAYLTGVLTVLYGPRGVRAGVRIGVLFSILALLVWLSPALDLPLRKLAGEWAMEGLSWLGQKVVPLTAGTADGPQFLLEMGGRRFQVASECNGFGALTCGLTLALALAVQKTDRWFVRAGYVVGCTIAGLVVNALRIICIMLLAPHMQDYHFMHEAVGYGALGVVLLATWLASRLLTQEAPREVIPHWRSR